MVNSELLNPYMEMVEAARDEGESLSASDRSFMITQLVSQALDINTAAFGFHTICTSYVSPNSAQGLFEMLDGK